MASRRGIRRKIHKPKKTKKTLESRILESYLDEFLPGETTMLTVAHDHEWRDNLIRLIQVQCEREGLDYTISDTLGSSTTEIEITRRVKHSDCRCTIGK